MPTRRLCGWLWIYPVHPQQGKAWQTWVIVFFCIGSNVGYPL